MLQLPQNIRLIRLIADKSQTDFGSLFNATKAMIVSYERGKAAPDELFISRLSQYAGVSEEDIKNKALKEEDIKGLEVKKVEKLEAFGVSPTNTGDQFLKESVRNLTETNRIHAENEKISLRNIERLIALLEQANSAQLSKTHAGGPEGRVEGNGFGEARPPKASDSLRKPGKQGGRR